MTFRFRGIGHARTGHVDIGWPSSFQAMTTTWGAVRAELPPSLQPTEISEERAAQLLAWQHEDERVQRREFWGTLLALIGAGALGCAVVAQGFRVTDRDVGQIWVSGGMLLGDALILLILVRMWLRRQRDE